MQFLYVVHSDVALLIVLKDYLLIKEGIGFAVKYENVIIKNLEVL